MKYLSILALSLFIVSCGDDAADDGDKTASEGGKSGNSEEVQALKSKISELEGQIEQKEFALRETAEIMNEIQDNLAQISYKRGKIQNEGINQEIDEAPKEWILDEINAINELRLENAKKVQQLTAAIKKREAEIGEKDNTIATLNTMVESLNNQLAIAEQENEILKVQLQQVDEEYSQLLDSYLESADQLDNATDKLNTAYYAYGTRSELKDNKVITKEGGIIGIGGANKLKDDFNDEYFTQIDILQTKEIEIMGNKPELITSHPSSSYELVEGDGKYKLKIKDADKFWGASKYLVVVVK